MANRSNISRKRPALNPPPRQTKTRHRNRPRPTFSRQTCPSGLRKLTSAFTFRRTTRAHLATAGSHYCGSNCVYAGHFRVQQSRAGLDRHVFEAADNATQNSKPDQPTRSKPVRRPAYSVQFARRTDPDPTAPAAARQQHNASLEPSVQGQRQFHFHLKSKIQCSLRRPYAIVLNTSFRIDRQFRGTFNHRQQSRQPEHYRL